MDWLAHALPRGGKSAHVPTLGELAERDVPTCYLTDRIGGVRERLQQTEWRVCVVVNEGRIVLGLLWSEALEADPQTPVEEVMDCAPSTIRPNISPEDAGEYMRDIDCVLVTTSDGVLLGLFHAEDHKHKDNEDKTRQNRTAVKNTARNRATHTLPRLQTLTTPGLSTSSCARAIIASQHTGRGGQSGGISTEGTPCLKKTRR